MSTCAYLPDMPEEELRDVLRRRVACCSRAAAWATARGIAAPDGSFELSYDSTALVELRAGFTRGTRLGSVTSSAARGARSAS